jgi:hypothetical protein
LRRTWAGIYTLLLSLVTIAVAEAALVALLVGFSYVLKIRLILEVGTIGAGFSSGPFAGPMVTLYAPTAVAAVLSTAVSGLVGATWTFRHWRPER